MFVTNLLSLTLNPVLFASPFRRILFASQFRRIRHQRIAPCPRAGRGRYMFVTNLLSLTLNLSSLPLSCVESSLPLCFVESDTNGSLPVLALAGAAIYVCNEPPKPYPEPVLVASQFRRILFSSQFRRIRHQRIAPCPRAGRGRYMFVTNLLSLTLNLSSLPLSFVESSLPLSFVESDTNGSLPVLAQAGAAIGL